MQTSGTNGSNSFHPANDRAARMAGFGLVASMCFLAVAAFTCSPGEIDCERAPKTCAMSPTGGTGGQNLRPTSCDTLGLATIEEVETKFIVMRCGIGPMGQNCHKGVFPPRLDMAPMIRTALLDKKGVLSCMSDLYVNKTDVQKSIVFAKINATGRVKDFEATCPSGPMTAPDVKGNAGAKMPNQPAMPLSEDENSCLTWYFKEIARL